MARSIGASLLVLVGLATTTCGPRPRPELPSREHRAEPYSAVFARIDTIELWLYSNLDGDCCAQGLVAYPPGHPDYAALSSHVGGADDRVEADPSLPGEVVRAISPDGP